MSYEKDLSNFRVIESSLQDIFGNLESVTTEDLVKSLDSLVEFVEDYKVKLQTREKIESYLLDFEKYPIEAFTEILKVLEKFETPDAEFSVNALDEVPCGAISENLTNDDSLQEYRFKFRLPLSGKSLGITKEEHIKKTPKFPVVEILGKFYETVPERVGCEGCAFYKKKGCTSPNGYLTSICFDTSIIYKEVSTGD